MNFRKVPREVADATLGGWTKGQNKRIVHEYRDDGTACSIGKNPALSVTRVDNGWFYMCFRCGISGMLKDSIATAEDAQKELEALTKHAETKVTPNVSLPFDFVPMLEKPTEEGVPYLAYNWLWKYSIDEKDMKRFNIGWSNKFNRCIIPIYEYSNDGQTRAGLSKEIVGWVGRDCTDISSKDRKKNTKAPAKYITRKKKGYQRVYFHAPYRSNTYIIVEDIVSAIRVSSAAGVNAFALLTTHIPPLFLLKLRKSKVILWLDNDQLENMADTVSKGSSLGVDISYIHTSRDPKSYNDFALQSSIILSAP